MSHHKIRRTGTHVSGVSQIIVEQLQLMKTEKDLKELLEKVNNQINELIVSIQCFGGSRAMQSSISMGSNGEFFLILFQVEELQLKSGLVEVMQKPSKTESDGPSDTRFTIDNNDPISINKQNLNLFTATRTDEEFDD